MTHIFGTHPVDNGGIDMAVRRSAHAGLEAVQIFTAIPKFYGDKSTIRPERVERFRQALAETGMKPEHVVVHGAYVLNTASFDATARGRAHAGLVKELERSSELGVGGVCFHPGSAGAGDLRQAIRWVSEAITRALETVDSRTRVWVENTAGAGKTVGRTAEEVGAILDGVPSSLRRRTGYGLDTCHLFSAGYDIAHANDVLTATLDGFEQATGEPPSFFHLNDSQFPLGSNRDRHTLLGKGEMGVEPFRWLLHDERSRGIPLILETPQLNVDVAKDDPSGDPYDVEMCALLKELAK